MTDSKDKKENKFYDENGGLYFMRNWPPVLRWVCILPAMIIIFLLAKFMFIAPVILMIEKSSEVLGLYVAALISFVPYFAVIDIAAAVAPKKRVLVSIIAALIIGILLILFAIYFLIAVWEQNIFEDNMNVIIAFVIASISAILGLALGVVAAKERQKDGLKSTTNES